MTLKHTNVAKWAKQQLSRDDRDPAVRMLLKYMLSHADESIYP